MSTLTLTGKRTKIAATFMFIGIAAITLFFIFQTWFLIGLVLLLQIPIIIVFFKDYGKITEQYIKHSINVLIVSFIVMLMEAIFAGFIFAIYILIRLI